MTDLQSVVVGVPQEGARIEVATNAGSRVVVYGGSNSVNEPPPSCSRKLRKYSFAILINKYVLYAVSCLIWMGGLLLVAFGVWARLEDAKVGYLQLLPFDPVALLIGLGTLSVVISFFGCIGSVRENVILLKIFCGAVGALFVVELASCIVGFVSVNSINGAVAAKFYESMTLYDDDDQIHGLVDRIQKDYECCGALGPNDWDRNAYYNCSSKLGSVYLPSACGVPASCCHSPTLPPHLLAVTQQVPGVVKPIASFPAFPLNEQCGFGIRRLPPSAQTSEINTAGCADHITESLSKNLLYVAVVALAISCLELISILLAFMLLRRITTVIEFMNYVRNGQFVEIDPGRLVVSRSNGRKRSRQSRRSSSSSAAAAARDSSVVSNGFDGPLATDRQRERLADIEI